MDEIEKNPTMDEAVSEKPWKSRYGLTLRAISLIVVIAFLGQDFVYAQGGTPLWSNVTKPQTADSGKDIQNKLQKIVIPNDAGLARKVVARGAAEDVIINIQDAHSKLGAQESITKILDNLVKNYDLNLIALEGASDLVDTSLVQSFPIAEVRKQTGEYLLKEGKISAGEFYSMIAESPVTLYGVDDASLYRENLEVFKGLIEKKTGIRKELKGLNKALRALETKVYPQSILELSSKKLLHKNGDIKFTDYWQYFSGLAKSHGVDHEKYRNLKKLADAVELEKEIDFKKATFERNLLVEELGQKLPKPELEKLILQALQFKQNKTTPGAFHYYLSQVSQGAGINPLDYRNIILYSQYAVLYESIDLIAIFDEVESFEDELKEKMFTSDDERTLSNLSRCVSILSRLLDTTLTAKEYEFYKTNEPSCEIEAIRAEFDRLGLKYRVPYEAYVDFDALESSIPSAKRFYTLATERNRMLLANTLKRMKAENTHVAALITGGFHSEGISKLMDEEKLSYLVVMPKFDDKSPDRPYLAILTQKPKEYEEEFKDSDFYIAAASYLNLQNRFYSEDSRNEFLWASFAALMAASRSMIGSEGVSPEFKDSFYNAYKAGYEKKGGIVSPAELRAWLDSVTVRRTQEDADTIAFATLDGRSVVFAVATQNKAIASIRGGLTGKTAVEITGKSLEAIQASSQDLLKVSIAPGGQVAGARALSPEVRASLVEKTAAGVRLAIEKGAVPDDSYLAERVALNARRQGLAPIAEGELSAMTSELRAVLKPVVQPAPQGLQKLPVIDRPLAGIPRESVKTIFVNYSMKKVLDPKLGETIIDIYPLVDGLRRDFPEATIYVASYFPKIFTSDNFSGKVISLPVETVSKMSYFRKESFENLRSFVADHEIDMVIHVMPSGLFKSEPLIKYPGKQPYVIGVMSPVSNAHAMFPNYENQFADNPAIFVDREGRQSQVSGFSDQPKTGVFLARGVWLQAIDTYRILGLNMEPKDIQTIQLSREKLEEAWSRLGELYQRGGHLEPFDRTKRIFLINMYAVTHRDLLSEEQWVEVINNLVQNLDNTYFLFTHGGIMDQDYTYVERVYQKAKGRVGKGHEASLIFPRMEIDDIHEFLGLVRESHGFALTLDTGFSHLAAINGVSEGIITFEDIVHWLPPTPGVTPLMVDREKYGDDRTKDLLKQVGGFVRMAEVQFTSAVVRPAGAPRQTEGGLPSAEKTSALGARAATLEELRPKIEKKFRGETYASFEQALKEVVSKNHGFPFEQAVVDAVGSQWNDIRSRGYLDRVFARALVETEFGKDAWTGFIAEIQAVSDIDRKDIIRDILETYRHRGDAYSRFSDLNEFITFYQLSVEQWSLRDSIKKLLGEKKKILSATANKFVIDLMAAVIASETPRVSEAARRIFSLVNAELDQWVADERSFATPRVFRVEFKQLYDRIIAEETGFSPTPPAPAPSPAPVTPIEPAASVVAEPIVTEPVKTTPPAAPIPSPVAKTAPTRAPAEPVGPLVVAPPAPETVAQEIAPEPVSRWKNAVFYAASAFVLTSVFAFFVTTPLWVIPAMALLFGTLGYREIKTLEDVQRFIQYDVENPAIQAALLERVKNSLGLTGLKTINDHFRQADQKKEISDEEKALNREKWIAAGIGWLGLTLTFVTAGALTGALALVAGFSVGWLLALGFFAFLVVRYVLTEAVFAWREARVEKAGVFGALKRSAAALVSGAVYLVVGLPYHLFKMFVLGIFEAKIKTYWFALFSYTGQLIAPPKNAAREWSPKSYIAQYVLPWLSDDEIRSIVRAEATSLQRERSFGETLQRPLESTSAGFWLKLAFESLLTGGALEFFQRRSVLMVAALVGGPLISAIGLGLWSFVALAAIVLTLRLAKTFKTIKAKGWTGESVRRILYDVILALVFANLGISGYSPDGFDILKLGWEVVIPAFGKMHAHTLFFTVGSFLNSAATLFVLNLKDIAPATRQELFSVLNDILRQRIGAETYVELLKSLNQNAVITSFRLADIHKLLNAKKEDGSFVLSEEQHRVLVGLLDVTVRSNKLHPKGFGMSFTGLSAYQRAVVHEYLYVRLYGTSAFDAKAEAEINARFNVTSALVKAAWNTLTSPKFWLKIAMGTPGMWFVGTEIAIIVGASEQIGFQPLTTAVKAIEGDPTRLGETGTLGEKIAQGGALGIAHNLWGAALDQTVELADRSGFGGYLSRGLGVD
ncbi:MAG: hypothetical protein HYZ87_00540, partial [Candidatus Omnitrophica bacterium]|nr:hypothetical protein [Candidatus Omnitrophota bacterium]